MLEITKVIAELEKRKKGLDEKAREKRLEMVDQDGPNESRYIAATRWVVEGEIEAMDEELLRLELGIKELRRLGGEKNRYWKNYFVSNSFECLELGIISKKTEMGRDVLTRVANAKMR